jgi:hypothetical protein
VHTIEVLATGEQENPPVAGPGTMLARFNFDDQTRRVDWSLTVQGISQDQVTAAHIHRGAVGVNGPIIHNLVLEPFDVAQGSLTLSEADVADLRAGNLYVNVHSLANPGGFARAQLYLTAEQGIRASIEGAVAAWNRRDAPGFARFFTDQGLREFAESGGGPPSEGDPPSRAELIAELAMFIGEEPVSLRGVTVLQASGRQAAALLDFQVGSSLERDNVTLVHEGVWKVSSWMEGTVPIPSGVTPLDVRLQEFAFVYDRAQASAGPVAFRVSNVGRQEHELVLFRITSNQTLQQIIQSAGPDEEPEGIEFEGFTFAEPGDQGTIVFTRALANGRYGMVCFIPDTDGTPHAFKGMLSEFTVTGSTSGGGSGIAPPSTGDAGLKSADYTLSIAALAVAGVLFGLGGATAVVARRRS